MKPPRILKALAMLNVITGVLLFIWDIYGLVVDGPKPDDKFKTGFFVLAAMSVIIAASFAFVGANYLKRPSRKNALRLAASSSVIVWFLLNYFLIPLSLELKGMDGMMICYLVVIGIALAAHRFWLRPVALRAFPDDELQGAK